MEEKLIDGADARAIQEHHGCESDAEAMAGEFLVRQFFQVRVIFYALDLHTLHEATEVFAANVVVLETDKEPHRIFAPTKKRARSFNEFLGDNHRPSSAWQNATGFSFFPFDADFVAGKVQILNANITQGFAASARGNREPMTTAQ
jgi:hypothetical protein